MCHFCFFQKDLSQLEMLRVMQEYNVMADGVLSDDDDDSWPPLTQKSNRTSPPTSPLYSIWSSPCDPSPRVSFTSEDTSPDQTSSSTPPVDSDAEVSTTPCAETDPPKVVTSTPLNTRTDVEPLSTWEKMVPLDPW